MFVALYWLVKKKPSGTREKTVVSQAESKRSFVGDKNISSEMPGG